MLITIHNSTKAITAVKDPAYEGRTSLLTLSSIHTSDLLEAIDLELRLRDTVEVQ